MSARSSWLLSARRHSTRSATYQQRQFELLVPALQTFQRLHGHCAVPLRFTVPSTRNAEAQQWPEELQGMKLGTTISRFLKACASAKKTSRRRSLDQVRAQLQELGVPEVEDWKRYLWDEVTKVNNLRCGNAEEIQEIELIYKNWMLLETLHGVEERDHLDTEDNER
ncbi:hypothetical protein PC123_g3272 [Phytophthora cactorum]|nr:hypothetical protein PC123_g3272 [Phytophthora cactorum]